MAMMRIKTFPYRTCWNWLLAEHTSGVIKERMVKIPLALEPYPSETVLLMCLMGQCMTHGQRLMQESKILNYYVNYLAKELCRKWIHPKPLIVDDEEICLNFLTTEQDPDWIEEEMPKMN